MPQLALTHPWDFRDPTEVGHRKCPDGKKGYQWAAVKMTTFHFAYFNLDSTANSMHPKNTFYIMIALIFLLLCV